MTPLFTHRFPKLNFIKAKEIDILSVNKLTFFNKTLPTRSVPTKFLAECLISCSFLASGPIACANGIVRGVDVIQQVTPYGGQTGTTRHYPNWYPFFCQFINVNYLLRAQFKTPVTIIRTLKGYANA